MFLVGFMGAGKTSVGRTLGEQLGWDFEDLDDRIERREGRTVAEIFRTSGEPEFRRVERSALRDLLQGLRGGPARIVALGGGAFVQRANAVRLKAAGVPTIFLDATIEELWERCQQQASQQGMERPLLSNRVRFAALHKSRRRGYMKASSRIETDGRSIQQIAQQIARALGLKKV